MIRNMSYECFFSNPAFLSLLLNWRGDLHVVLTNTVPPYFVDSSRGEDPSWYHLLQNKLDYRAEIYIPGTLDYGWIISPSKSVLELFMDLVGHLSDKAL